MRLFAAAISALVLSTLFGAVAPVGAAGGVSKTPVSYSVSLAQDALLSGNAYTVRGFRYTGDAPSKTVVLLLHGLSYGYWAWDFPVPDVVIAAPYQYSIARYLASHGFDAVAIDELGYGSSDHPPFPDSRQLTIPAYANMAHQVVQKLRQAYARVIIVGHSAGGEISNFEAGRYRDVDGLADVSMCDVLASLLVITDITRNSTLGAIHDYGYFGNNVPGRTALMYYLPDADPAIVAKDNSMLNPTPTSEAQSIAPQPARWLDPLVNVPVLVAFSDHDAIFPPKCQQFQPLLYASSPRVTVFHMPQAGHSLMLHRNAPALEAALLAWLQSV